MARKAEAGIRSYNIKCNHMGDTRVKLLIGACGDTGYKVWQFILSYGHDKWGYYFDMNKTDDVELFASDNCKVSLEQLQVIIERCVSKELFDKDVYEQYKVLTSVDMQQAYISETSSRRSGGTIVPIYREYLLIDPPGKDTVVIIDLGEVVEQVKRRAVRELKGTQPKGIPKQPVQPSAAEIELKEHKKLYQALEKKPTQVLQFIKDHRPRFIDPYMDLWNIWAGKNGKPKVSLPATAARKEKFRLRIKEERWDFPKCLEVMSKSNFCMANNSFNFDFLFKNEQGYVKLLEGSYDNQAPAESVYKQEPNEPVNPSLARMEEQLNNKMTA